MLVNSSPTSVSPIATVGTVYGVALNDPAQLAALGDAVNQPPYKAPPRAPVLYLKPRNTHAQSGARVEAPAESEGLAVGATIGLVLGRDAWRGRTEDVWAHVSACLLVVDLSVPHVDVYRPSVRLKARDASCVMGTPVALTQLNLRDPASLALQLRVASQEPVVLTFSGLVRDPAKLLADVSEFMTLRAGDVLLIGLRHGAPVARPGDSFHVDGGVLGTVHGQVTREAAA